MGLPLGCLGNTNPRKYRLRKFQTTYSPTWMPIFQETKVPVVAQVLELERSSQRNLIRRARADSAGKIREKRLQAAVRIYEIAHLGCRDTPTPAHEG